MVLSAGYVTVSRWLFFSGGCTTGKEQVSKEMGGYARLMSREEKKLSEGGWVRRHGTRIYHELKTNIYFSHKA